MRDIVIILAVIFVGENVLNTLKILCSTKSRLCSRFRLQLHGTLERFLPLVDVLQGLFSRRLLQN